MRGKTYEKLLEQRILDLSDKKLVKDQKIELDAVLTAYNLPAIFSALQLDRMSLKLEMMVEKCWNAILNEFVIYNLYI